MDLNSERLNEKDSYGNRSQKFKTNLNTTILAHYFNSGKGGNLYGNESKRYFYS